jgi:hypothetical protein
LCLQLPDFILNVFEGVVGSGHAILLDADSLYKNLASISMEVCLLKGLAQQPHFIE